MSKNTINDDLKREREKASFSVEKLTNLMDGGKDRTSRRRYIEAIIQRDPTGIFCNEDNNYLHRTDRYVRGIAKHVRMIELCRKLGIGDKHDGQILLDKDFLLMLTSLGDDLPTVLHWGMFVPNLVCLWDDDQQKEWLPLIRDWRMMGCYAQTELGHGSNVRALETTATFLSEEKGGLPGGSFVINSPTITSTKFWPGTLGRTANHAVLIARLIDGDGVDRGIQNFLVQLRSMKDHKLLKGITTGDIGPKIGYNTMDNGFCQFNNVQIPRRNMAMRFAEADTQGKFRPKSVSGGSDKIAYITMMRVRAFIVNDASRNLAMACTISIRYSAVRKQGYANEDNKTELQILDYRQQQRRLLYLLYASYCFFFTGRKVFKRLYAIESKIRKNITVTKLELSDLHASSSGLKSYTTSVTADGIEDCRKACGGHGFLQCSGLPELATTYLQNPTVEGDNHMLPQQVVKVLLKLVQAIESGSDGKEFAVCDSFLLVPSIRSILEEQEGEKCQAMHQQDMCSLSVLITAFRHRAARLLVEVAKQLQTSVLELGKTQLEAWNDALIEMARVSQAYSQFLLLQNFMDGIKEEEKKPRRQLLGHAEVTVLGNLARLCALSWMEDDMGDFLEDGHITATQAGWVRSNVLKLLDVIRPDAVALVDARDFSDFRLKSALGRYDGDVYPHILKAAKKDPLNQTDPGPGYEPHLKRLYVDGVGVYTGTSSRL